MTGVMRRVITFQSSVSLSRIIGCTLRTQSVAFLVPAPQLKLCWKGTLMRSATGFCVFVASSVSSCCAPGERGVVSANTAMTTGMSSRTADPKASPMWLVCLPIFAIACANTWSSALDPALFLEDNSQGDGDFHGRPLGFPRNRASASRDGDPQGTAIHGVLPPSTHVCRSRVGIAPWCVRKS